MTTKIWTGFIGKTITDIKKVYNNELHFEFDDGNKLEMYHQQDCCEEVYIEDIIGDLEDLKNSPITMFETTSEYDTVGSWGDTSTWTFYKIATIKGYVTIRWFGTSNGYYSEEVNLEYFDGDDTWSDFSLDYEEID